MTTKNYITRAQLPSLIRRARNNMGADNRAAEYLSEIIERAFDAFPLECGLSENEFNKALLAGAPNWRRASAGGCFLIAAADIGRRLGIDFTRDDASEKALRYQAQALEECAHALFSAYQDCRAYRRQFYVVENPTVRRGKVLFTVYEYREGDTRDPVPALRYATSGAYQVKCTRGLTHEAFSALVKAGKIPAEIAALFHDCGDFFKHSVLGDTAELCAYCTIDEIE